METSKNNIGKIIRKHRDLKNLSQEKVSEIVKRSQTTLYRYENNITVPNKAMWETLCKILEIPVDTYFPSSETKADYVKETNENIYNDKSLVEFIKLAKPEMGFIKKVGLIDFLKGLSNFSQEERKQSEITLKNIFKLIKRSNQNGS